MPVPHAEVVHGREPDRYLPLTMTATLTMMQTISGEILPISTVLSIELQEKRQRKQIKRTPVLVSR